MLICQCWKMYMFYVLLTKNTQKYHLVALDGLKSTIDANKM